MVSIMDQSMDMVLRPIINLLITQGKFQTVNKGVSKKKFMLKVQNQRDISDQFIYFLRLLDIFLDERKSLISLMISFMFWIGPL